MSICSAIAKTFKTFYCPIMHLKSQRKKRSQKDSCLGNAKWCLFALPLRRNSIGTFSCQIMHFQSQRSQHADLWEMSNNVHLATATAKFSFGDTHTSIPMEISSQNVYWQTTFFSTFTTNIPNVCITHIWYEDIRICADLWIMSNGVYLCICRCLESVQ